MPSDNKTKLTGGILLALAALALGANAAAAENYRFTPKPFGYDTAAERCVPCHSLEKRGEFRAAPNLWGIVGAEKARARKWFAYSSALLDKGGKWTEQDLDEFLADANKFAPGSTKTYKVADPEERKEIIDYLKNLQ